VSVLARDFDSAGVTLPPEHAEALGVYLSDLVAPHGLPPPAGPFTGGHSYGEMGRALIHDTVGPDAPVDLLVLAYAIPDVRPGRATAAYLSHVCPGVPMAFAICDQATAAPYSGLRVVREYARSGGVTRALLLIVEQAALYHEPAAPVTVPTGHSGCAVLCDVDAAPGVRLGPLRQQAGVSAVDGVAQVAEELAGLAKDGTPVTLILGGGLPPEAFTALVDRVRVAPAGRPVTGVWSRLATELSAGDRQTGSVVVMADHEPRLGYLSVATLRYDRSAGAAA
jgi:4-hydroxymandelate oxidase